MSLYLEAAKFLDESSRGGGGATASLKSRVYGAAGLKNRPAQVYALVSEATKWSRALSEVIERSGLLQAEKKLTPATALLLVHDLLLSRHGVAAPKAHALRLAVARHRARLGAEFARARVRLGFASVEAWRLAIDSELSSAAAAADGAAGAVHPRWVRVNTLLSDVATEMQTTFSGYDNVSLPAIVSRSASSDKKKLVAIDDTVPDLLALPPSATEDITKSAAYRSGLLILQDKASCLPALLLDPRPEDGDIVDACAAPGNKTTHLAALLARARNASPPHGRGALNGEKTGKHAAAAAAAVTKQTIFAIERSAERARTLRQMVRLAGADGAVMCLAPQDFLALDPRDARFTRVGALLLDPSCSGSGIVGRDDAAVSGGEGEAGEGEVEGDGEASAPGETAARRAAVVLPRPGAAASAASASSSSAAAGAAAQGQSKKRKRRPVTQPPPQPTLTTQHAPQPSPLTAAEHTHSTRNTEPQRKAPRNGETTPTTPPTSSTSLSEATKQRLTSLSAFQLHALTHALRFPAARKVIYSTCSVHAAENEAVVLAALASRVARARGWRVLRREEQVLPLRAWAWRGVWPEPGASLLPRGGGALGCGRRVPGRGRDGEDGRVGLDGEDAEDGEEKEGGEKRRKGEAKEKDDVSDEAHIHEVLDACIRCRKATDEGTMGFFAVGFVRDGADGADAACGAQREPDLFTERERERCREDEGEGEGEGEGLRGTLRKEAPHAGSDEEEDGDADNEDGEEEWGGFSDDDHSTDGDDEHLAHEIKTAD